MKRLIQCVVLVLGVIILNSANAQYPDSARKWTIEECFKYAAHHNIQINTFQLSQLSLEEDLTAAKGVRIPSLSGSAGNSFNNANNDVSGNGNLTNQLSTSGSYSLNSSIVLWNGNYSNNNIQQRGLLTTSAGLSVKQSFNNLTLLITQAYLDILLSKENLKYVTDLVSTSEAIVKQNQLFYDAGSIAKINLLQLQAQLAGDRYLLVQTQNAIRQNTLALKQLLQLPADSSFDIVTPLVVELSGTILPLSNVQQTAHDNFPEIQIGKQGMDIAALDIAKARAGFKPTLSATASMGTGYNDVLTNSVFSKAGYFTQSGNNFYQRLGVSLSIPIFSNRINSTNLAKAKIGYRQAALNYKNNELVLSQAVEQAYLNASNAQQAYISANEQLVAVTENYRIINEQYKLGGTNVFNVLLQRNLYVQAVQVYTQAKYTAVLQQKIYEFYTGIPLTF
jgi:outer membrane protein